MDATPDFIFRAKTVRGNYFFVLAKSFEEAARKIESIQEKHNPAYKIIKIGQVFGS